jgi:secreted trypsin-like serine protease
VGKYNLNRFEEENSSQHRLLDVFVHKDWKQNETSFDANIALAFLESDVDLSRPFKVSPICLPPANTATIAAGTGVVVGFGLSESNEVDLERPSITPRILRIPIVHNDHCFKVEKQLGKFSSNRTFCGGFPNDHKSSCVGHSGGGFFQRDPTTRNWNFNLVGIVSSSLFDPLSGCMDSSFSIFTDVAQFVGWIEDKMEETKDRH